MRWPWQRDEHPSETARHRAVPDRQVTSAMGWAFLPPLQRTFGDLPTVSRPAAFPRELPAWRDPSFSGTLGHLMSSDAPSGVIDGDGSGTGSPTLRSATPDLTLLPPRMPRPSVQRTPASADRADLTSATSDGLPLVQAPVVEEPRPVLPTEVSTPHSTSGPEPADGAGMEPAPEDEAADTTGDHPLLSEPKGRSNPTAEPDAVQRPEAVQRSALDAPLAKPLATTPRTTRRRLGLGDPLPAVPPAATRSLPHAAAPDPPAPEPAPPPGPPPSSTDDLPSARAALPPAAARSAGAPGATDHGSPALPQPSVASRPDRPLVGDLDRPMQRTAEPQPATPLDPAPASSVPSVRASRDGLPLHETRAVDDAGADDHAGEPAPASDEADPPDSQAPEEERETTVPEAAIPRLAVDRQDTLSPAPPSRTADAAVLADREALVPRVPAAVVRRQDPGPAAPASPPGHGALHLQRGHGAAATAPTAVTGAATTAVHRRDARSPGDDEVTRASIARPGMPPATEPAFTVAPSTEPAATGDEVVPIAGSAATSAPVPLQLMRDDVLPTMPLAGSTDSGRARLPVSTLAATPIKTSLQRSTPLAAGDAPTPSPRSATVNRSAPRPAGSAGNGVQPTSHGPGAVQRAVQPPGRPMTSRVTRSLASATVQRTTEPTTRPQAPRLQRAAAPEPPAASRPGGSALPLVPPGPTEAPSGPMVADELAALGIPVTVSRQIDTATEVPLHTAAATAGTGTPPTTTDAQPAGPAGVPGAAPAAHTPEEVEALAQKLFRPLMRRIKAEMLLDRERSGLRTDMW